MKVLDRAQQTVSLWLPRPIDASLILLVGLMATAAFTRFWRLGSPDDFFFDEVYHAFTAREFLHGNKAAWEFFATPPEGFAYEWTHPPLAKLFMAGGMLFFGENPFGWRFFGALFGVGSVFFVYLLGKKLFKSEIVALSAATVMTLEGLLFVQSRIATADIYLVFFTLGSLYFLVAERHLLAGIFFGAALATKWTAIFIALPVAFYFAYRLLQADKAHRSRFIREALLIVPPAYVAVPLFIYFLSYVPFFLAGHDLGDLWDLQRQMYWYHSGLKASHPYESMWYTWPFDYRPVYLWVSGSGHAQIYALGNPIIFWLGLPALAYALWQVLRKLRLKLASATGEMVISGRLGGLDFALLFVLVSYFSFLLPWALVSRIVFIYHYLPALTLMTLAIGYAIGSLWRDRWGRLGAIAFLAAAFLTFVYFYPHLAALPVPGWLQQSYFWFSSWR